MKILIARPAARESRTGNQVTAERWARVLRGLGHRVTVSQRYSSQNANLLIALHARKSGPAIRDFHRRYPERPIVVAMTGTDLHDDLPAGRAVLRSLELAHRIVLLEPSGLRHLPEWAHERTHVIYQSADRLDLSTTRRTACFEVCVVGHLRPVKDPFRAARAARLLPPSSRIFVTHLGAALTPAMKRAAEREMDRNARYRWHDNLSRRRTQRVLARSRLLVLTSKSEGGPNVLCEALMADTPVISTSIAGAVGMLGRDYPGYFPVGDTRALADLLLRCETDARHYRELVRACRKRKRFFTPERERKEWQRLLRGLGFVSKAPSL